MCVYVLRQAYKHDISRTVHWIRDICGTQIAHGPQMCPIVLGTNVMHINEQAGLNVKILKSSWCIASMYIFGSDAASIRNLCGPVGVGGYV